MSLVAAALEISGGVLDDTSTPVCVVVPSDQWVAAAKNVHAAGARRAEWLTAADFGDKLRVVVAARSTSDQLLLATEITGPGIASLCAVWPGLVWHERECSEMFGIEFAGLPDARPLLLAGVNVTAPLRRTSPLSARINRAWPGAVTASGATPDGPARGRRAVGLPPGVRAEWADPDEQGGGRSD